MRLIVSILVTLHVFVTLKAILAFTFLDLIDLVCIICLHEAIDQLLVLWRAFGGSDDISGALEVKKVVCGHNCLQTMSDHDDCKVASLLLLHIQNGILHLSFTLGVQCAGGLVENQNLRFLNQGACDCNALFLASREVQNSAGADVSVQPLLHVLNKVGVREVD